MSFKIALENVSIEKRPPNQNLKIIRHKYYIILIFLEEDFIKKSH